MLPFGAPTDKPTHRGLPLIYRDAAAVFGEFRLFGTTRFAINWAQTFPRAPLPREEVKAGLRQQLERDVLILRKLLRMIGSASADFMVRLELARGSIQAAMSILGNEGAARATLAAI